MNTATIDQVRSNARWLERREADRMGNLTFARASIARESGITLSSWHNLVRGRLKRIDVWMRDRLQALVVRELEKEIGRLTHELQTARRCSAHLDASQITEIEKYLLKAKSLLGISSKQILMGDQHVVDERADSNT